MIYSEQEVARLCFNTGPCSWVLFCVLTLGLFFQPHEGKMIADLENRHSKDP